MKLTKKKEFTLVAIIQERFADSGWRWSEETFDNGDVVIRFTLSKEFFALDFGTGHSIAPYSWGRFQRLDAWERAQSFLLYEKGNHETIERLREYKRKYREQPA